MTEDWNTTDELKKDIITAVYKDINDQIEEMAVSYTHLTLPTTPYV